MQPHMAQTALR
uniref:Uncharacterized protein n=1 Tax=Timema bartmani TaxID=61472 RepID=A0A7R9FAK3_9NEOP|nr:unnamed protein product [Timema bartmani]